VDEAALAVGNIKGSEICGVDGISHGAQLGQYIDAERVALAARAESVFEKVDSHVIGIVIHGVSESTTRDECRCPAASAVPIRAT